MGSGHRALLGILGIAALALGNPRRGGAQTDREQVVRIAEIEIDPAQAEPYKTALRRGIESAIRLEPGVLAIYAVSVKDHPEQIRIFERYASQAAYEAHLQTPHFKAYKTATAGMVRSLRLVDTQLILLGSRQP